MCGMEGRSGLTRLVESDVAILADSTKEEFDSAVLLDLGLVRIAFRDEILRISVQNVHLGRRNVD